MIFKIKDLKKIVAKQYNPFKVKYSSFFILYIKEIKCIFLSILKRIEKRK